MGLFNNSNNLLEKACENTARMCLYNAFDRNLCIIQYLLLLPPSRELDELNNFQKLPHTFNTDSELFELTFLVGFRAKVIQ